MEELIALDQELFVFLNQMGNHTFDRFWLVMTHKATNISLYLILSFVFLKQTQLKSFLSLLLFVGLLIWVTDQSTNLFKYGF